MDIRGIVSQFAKTVDSQSGVTGRRHVAAGADARVLSAAPPASSEAASVQAADSTVISAFAQTAGTQTRSSSFGTDIAAESLGASTMFADLDGQSADALAMAVSQQVMSDAGLAGIAQANSQADAVLALLR